MVRCPQCGTDSPDQARFCRACGSPLAAEGGAERPAPPSMTAEDRARRLLEEAFRLSEEGQVLAAIQSCQQAIAINPNSTSAHSLLGTLYERQGEREAAIREYEQVLSLSPGSTVERRRLNELMGVPAAREAVAVSPGTARLAVTGGALVVTLVLVGAIIMSFRQSSSVPGERAVAQGSIVLTPEEPVLAEPYELVPSPGAVYRQPQPVAPRTAGFRGGPQRAAGMRAAGRYGSATQVAPGTYLVPVTGAQRPFVVGRPGPRAPTPPFEGAVLLGEGELPAVRASPGQVLPARAPPARRLSPGMARTYYFQGDYQSAINAYQTYLARNPDAGAGPREELAWVYVEAGKTEQAVGQYREALSRYRDDIERGHNVEAARHGVRTSEAALRALEVR